jgi:hypothetical protein
MSVIELRRYAMKPGRRDDLIGLFEREFIESQEACGMTPIGHFRDMDDENAFVWFREFANMESRRRSLEAFYVRSDAWRQNRAAANDTMIDSDNVLLLRPARPNSGFDVANLRRQPHSAGAPHAPSSYISVSIDMLPAPASDDYIMNFERSVLPQLRDAARHCAYFVTEAAPNTFPALPVREGEYCFVAIGVCDDVSGLEAWRGAFPATEGLRLVPARRSLLQ